LLVSKACRDGKPVGEGVIQHVVGDFADLVPEQAITEAFATATAIVALQPLFSNEHQFAYRPETGDAGEHALKQGAPAAPRATDVDKLNAHERPLTILQSEMSVLALDNFISFISRVQFSESDLSAQHLVEYARRKQLTDPPQAYEPR